jgi:hypothetical protein
MRESRWAMTILVATMAIPPAWGAPVRIFRTQSGDAFLKGVAEGVAVESDGALRLARRADPLATIEAPFAFALARTKNGWAVGTGNEGHVYEIDGAGKAKVLFDAPEPEVFALWADPDGSLFVGSSPNGKVYRVTASGSEVFFDPEETYVWAIARGADGALWVATGSPGRLYRVREAGKGERIWDGGATHVRSLLPLPGGELLFGTAGDGRLLRWQNGKTRTLLDSELNEVVALAAGPNGTAWVALLASEASFVDLAPRAAASPGGGDDAGKGVVTVEEGAPGGGSRPAGVRTPRSQLLRLLPSGATEEVWSSADESLFAILPEGERLWAGTGLEGRLYLFESDRARVEKVFTAKQVVALGADAGGLVALTANGSALSRLTSVREAQGTYTSPALDAGQPAGFGVFRWAGELPKGSHLRSEFRSGFAAEPDATWSEWSAPREGTELPLAALDRGRFVQYRLRLEGAADGGPRIASTELSYRQENLRPEIDSLVALDPGQVLVPAGFNPADQVYEPASPNRQGIFDSLRATPPPVERLKTLWRKGWRTLKWDVTDPNGDELRYRLEVRRDGPGEQPWLELGHDLADSAFAFDATALPDGLYRFRLTASDERGNEASAALSRAFESEPVLIDQTPPVLGNVQRGKDEIRVTVTDAASPLRAAEVSIDGADWRPARPADGLLDGRSETLVVDALPAGARLVLLRVTDAAFNVRTFDLLAEVKR